MSIASVSAYSTSSLVQQLQDQANNSAAQGYLTQQAARAHLHHHAAPSESVQSTTTTQQTPLVSQTSGIDTFV